ncbi:helix-turn-helix transcriptional regulator [Methylomicrobium sp. Wu6]|uniref:helix-turn-helix transcriptional regulator n=1 Tax=Methylomicrobium sp. Wu6 TaxID=3107928 RepID=UPI002DD655DD|nr:helix-turn-helix transcriptional regulator [Methylomicrobium sp. Wu6]MEC4749444.1 helix-turn-helix transcriptional regulator [Methylomicrobium sp. Wu6]
MARSYSGGVERGKRNIALLNICKLADALSVSPAEMLQFHCGAGGFHGCLVGFHPFLGFGCPASRKAC